MIHTPVRTFLSAHGRIVTAVSTGHSRNARQWRRVLVALTIVAALGGPTLVSRAATIVDLTTAGNEGTINGAIYQQVDPQSTGTGTVGVFVQVKAGGSATTEHAYNTTENNTLDVGPSDIHNHSITLADVSLVLHDGSPYRRFLLDINESSGGVEEFLSLDEVQIFVGGTANDDVETFTGGVLDHDGTLVYRMDAGMDNWVAMDYSLNTGSGSGDMFLFVPAALFAGFAGTDVVTLYSQFGLQGELAAGNPAGVPAGNYGISANFEEWSTPRGTPDGPGDPEVPEPTSLIALSLLIACVGAGGFRCRK